ncbi:MAG: dynamin family protein [Gemmatimonadaceae bacterium]
MPEVTTESLLQRLATLASRAGIEHIAEEARTLDTRIAEGRFYLACVGQFKRGKSTLLDALLGDPILPIGVLPVTAVPTVVRHGPERSARILIRGGEWRQIDIDTLASYVSEEENPLNEKEVAAVEVFHPSELLARGMCLVDTPGVGSVFETSSTATYNFVPHIDAALVVLGADPPISSEELELATSIARHAQDMVFVLNKADRVSPTETAAAKQFARSVLASRLGRPVTIFEISAKDKLDGNRDGRDWAKLTVALQTMAESSGRRLVRLALERGIRRLASWLGNTMQDEVRALTEPLEQSDARLRELSEFIAHSEQAIRDLGSLLLAEQQQLSDRLERRRGEFVARIAPIARAELARSRANSVRLQGPRLRRYANQAALSIAENAVTPWLREEEQTVEREYSQVTQRFTDLANKLLSELARADIPQLQHVAEAIETCGQLTAHSTFQFHQLLHIAQPASPLQNGADLLMVAVGITSPIWRDAEEFLEHVIDTNTSRIKNDLERRLAIARKELEVAIRAVLVDAGKVARSTLTRVRETRAAGDGAVRQQLAELKELDRELATLVHELSTS